MVFTIECSNRSNITIYALEFKHIERHPILMVRMLCYGHGDTSSNLVGVIVPIYSNLFSDDKFSRNKIVAWTV